MGGTLSIVLPRPALAVPLDVRAGKQFGVAKPLRVGDRFWCVSHRQNHSPQREAIVPPSESGSVDASMQALEQIEEKLGNWLAQAVDSAAPIAPTDATPARAALQQIEQRFASAQTTLDKAGGHAAELEALLNEEARALQQWTESVAGNRRRLANWKARSFE
jgi:hypothetical protein